ncbi:MAG: sulfur carrier protein ThiS [Candidatus Margulisbacteria bacterium]|nr:sulfur carrier protein ThiS [Candidatus Margulisiibacteriota bacterium]
MKLTLNGQNETLENETLTIEELLKIKDVKMPEMVTVEHNGEILDRAAFATTAVKEGDTLEFLYFMGGGSH